MALVSAGYNIPGQSTPADSIQVLPDGSIMPTLKSRTYFGDSCVNGVYDNSRYSALKLLGKTFKYMVDLSGAECGCNVALYLTSLHQNNKKSECHDYYCDANKVCGVRCAEIDIQEANKFAFRTTLHTEDDGDGVSKGIGGWDDDWSPRDYGPGGRCIDTKAAFEVAASFPINPSNGSLKAMSVQLNQPGKPCGLGLRLDEYSFKKKNRMDEMSRALAEGMTPIVSYWTSSKMGWMDGPGAFHGPCLKDDGTCGPEVKFYGFEVVDLAGPAPMTPQPTAPPTTPPPTTPAANPPPTTKPPPTTQPPATQQPTSTTVTLTTPKARYTTTPPKALGPCTYDTDAGKIAVGEFDVGVDGCHGVGECQFKTLQDAQKFCDHNEKCSVVVLHPYGNNCAGGYGCYTPRYGRVRHNLMMDSIGGRAWIKSPSCVPSIAGPYVYIGYHSPESARSACKPYGRLAMPKTPQQLELIETAIYEAFAGGQMSPHWPHNMVWIGARWNDANRRWEWDDNVPMGVPRWAAGSPHSLPEKQQATPFLSMFLDGGMQDSSGSEKFAVMCEVYPFDDRALTSDDGEALHETAHLRSMLDGFGSPSSSLLV